MKVIALFSLFVSGLAHASAIPRVEAENWGGYVLQPCIVWYTNGACGRYATGVDLANRNQVNRVVDFLEWRIQQLEARLAKVERK